MHKRAFVVIVFLCASLAPMYSKAVEPRSLKTVDDFIKYLRTDLPDTTRVDANIKVGELLMYSDPARAIQYCRVALKLAEKINNPRSMAYAYFHMAVQLRRQDKYAQAVKHYYKALGLYEKLKIPANVGRIHGSVALVYWAQKNYTEAMREFRLSLHVANTMGDSNGIYSNYNNMGGIYINTGKTDSAIVYLNKCYEYYKRNNDTTGLAEITGNLGDALLETGRYDEAEKYYLTSQYFSRLINHQYALMTSTGNLGAIFYKRKQYEKAIAYNKDAIRISLQLGAQSNRLDMYKSLAVIYSETGDYKNAFEYQRHYTRLRDTLTSDENTNQINELRLKYNVDKQEERHQADIKKREIEDEKREAERKLLIIAIILVLIIAGAVLVGYRQKNKAKKELERKNSIIESKSKEILDSINYARKIQYALLAHEDLLKKNLPGHFVFFKPKDIVSGDFYWGTYAEAPVPDGQPAFYLAVCDSTGHGVPGAFMSLLNISFLNEAINEKGITAPNEVFNHVRKRLIDNLAHEGAQDGMDATLLKFRISERGFRFGEISEISVEYAAAYNAPVIVRNGEIVDCAYDKTPIGKSETTAPFSLQKLVLQPGDMLYLYTDGYADQFGGPKGKKFKESNLKALLARIYSMDLDKQKQELERNFENWRGDLEQIDDICVLGIRI